MTEKEVIKLMRKHNIDEVYCNFNCGGDCMGDVDWSECYPENVPSEVMDSITDWCNNEMYNRVEFYINSDGHYMGEFGQVQVTIDEEYDGLSFSKASQSEWWEQYTNEFPVTLSDDEVAFLKENVQAIEQGEGIDLTFFYSGDVLITQEVQNILNSVRNKLTIRFDASAEQMDKECNLHGAEDIFSTNLEDSQNPKLEFYQNQLSVLHRHSGNEIKDDI